MLNHSQQQVQDEMRKDSELLTTALREDRLNDAKTATLRLRYWQRAFDAVHAALDN